MIEPRGTAPISTSIEAMARVEASGFIWLIRGHATAPTPTAPAAPVAMNRKSLRVGSTVEEVATITPLLHRIGDCGAPYGGQTRLPGGAVVPLGPTSVSGNATHRHHSGFFGVLRPRPVGTGNPSVSGAISHRSNGLSIALGIRSTARRSGFPPGSTQAIGRGHDRADSGVISA